METKERLKEKYDRLSQFENNARSNGYCRIAGLDEAGRGPLAGPVVAAACILPDDYMIMGLDDSKKLSSKKREILFDEIILNSISFCIIRIEEDDIDRINILEATKIAMRKCILGLSVRPDYVLTDAVNLPGIGIPCESIIKGDSRSNSIAAASILAKVTRDRIMCQYDKVFPGYGFAGHKGYGTKQHYEALDKLGACPIHRSSFLKKYYLSRGINE
jgi:ribonuclease HII